MTINGKFTFQEGATDDFHHQIVLAPSWKAALPESFGSRKFEVSEQVFGAEKKSAKIRQIRVIRVQGFELV